MNDNDKVEKLVERRAENIYKWSVGGQAWCDLNEWEKGRWREYARLALDDPDLALIDRERAKILGCESINIYPVIPLAEEVKK